MTSRPSPFDITLKTAPSDGVVRVVLAGEFDAGSVPAFDAATSRIVELNTRVVAVDLSGVSLLDSAAIGALMRLRATVQDQERSFELHAPREFQHRLFVITGLEHVLTSSSGAEPDLG